MPEKIDYLKAVELFNTLIYEVLNNVSKKEFFKAQKNLSKAVKLFKYLPKLNKIKQKYDRQPSNEVLEKDSLNKKLNEAVTVIKEQRNLIEELKVQMEKNKSKNDFAIKR